MQVWYSSLFIWNYYDTSKHARMLAYMIVMLISLYYHCIVTTFSDLLTIEPHRVVFAGKVATTPIQITVVEP